MNKVGASGMANANLINPTAEKTELLGLTLEEMVDVVKNLQLPAFTAKQLVRWIYVKRCADFASMSDISQKGRSILQENCKVGFSHPVKVSTSVDGSKKYLFATRNGYVESVYIPEGQRATLCISSQVGCRMGCKFCATGNLGFSGNLSTAEILNQVLSIDESESLTNIVYMGMGEPLDNLPAVTKSMEILQAPYALAMSYKRITLSSVGILPALEKFLDSGKCHLAISLHAANHDLRARIVPVEKAYPIEKVVQLLRKYDWSHQRRVSFEYTLLAGVNDSNLHAIELANLIRGLECRVNLIPFHDTGLGGFKPSSEKAIEAFKNTLEQKQINTTIRRSRGQDIDAACGMLSAKQDRKDKTCTNR